LTCFGLNLNPRDFGGSTSIYLVWRIACAYLVVCR
jgi:hypothetical protein